MRVPDSQNHFQRGAARHAVASRIFVASALGCWLAACASAPVANSPVEADPLYREARLDIGADRPQTAADKLESLVVKYGADPLLLRWLGRARIMAGKDVAGRDNLRQVLERHPEDTQARRWLADSCFVSGSDLDADARSQYELLLASDPENEQILRNLATLYLRAGDERQALAKLDVLLQKLPNDRGLREEAILATDGAADWEGLVRHAAAHLKNHGRSAVILQALARAKLAGDPAQASEVELRDVVPLLGEALLLEPNAPDLAYSLGLVHLHLARKTSSNLEQTNAERYLRRALDTDPRHVDAAQTLAALYEEQRNPQRALPLLEHALQVLLDQDSGNTLGLQVDRIQALRRRIEDLSSARGG